MSELDTPSAPLDPEAAAAFDAISVHKDRILAGYVEMVGQGVDIADMAQVILVPEAGEHLHLSGLRRKLAAMLEPPMRALFVQPTPEGTMRIAIVTETLHAVCWWDPQHAMANQQALGGAVS